MPRSSPPNALYLQSGGVTAVINASMAAVIEAVRAYPSAFGKLYGARNGLLGVLNEQLTELSALPEETVKRLKHLPGGALQSERFMLGDIHIHARRYRRVLEVLQAYDIRYLFYNGGNGSMETATLLADYCREAGHALTVVGIPKTIDNDLAGVHFSPGYGSAAKYLATAIVEAAYDLRAMHLSASKILVVETMGRFSGWLALAGALAQERLPDTPFLLVLPERPFVYESLRERVEEALDQADHCVIVVAEGVRLPDGSLFAVARPNALHQDWAQLGGAGMKLSDWLRRDLDCKIHTAIPDYLQRSAVHLRSYTDWQVAQTVARAAVELALQPDGHGRLPTIQPADRKTDTTHWHHAPAVSIAEVAAQDKTVPDSFITPDGWGATGAALDYLRPLIAGETPLPWRDGLPDYRPFPLKILPPRLPRWPFDPLIQR